MEGIEVLKGKVLRECIGAAGDDEIIFRVDDHEAYCLYHEQDCCESVRVEEIIGDLQCLVGSPILEAEEVGGDTGTSDEYDSYTWTFYKLATIRGGVTLRWLGISNGYYSESVDFRRM